MPKRRDQDFNWQEQVGAPPFQLRLRPKNPRLAVWMGYIISQIVGFGALAVALLPLINANPVWLPVWVLPCFAVSQFFLIPLGMGFIAANFWRDTLPMEVPDCEAKSEMGAKCPRPVVSGAAAWNAPIPSFVLSGLVGASPFTSLTIFVF